MFCIRCRFHVVFCLGAGRGRRCLYFLCFVLFYVGVGWWCFLLLLFVVRCLFYMFPIFCGFLPLDLLFGFCSCVRFMRCWFIVVSCMLCLICQWSPNIVCILYVDYTLLLWECCVGGVWVCVLWLKSQTGNTLMIKMALGTAPHNVYWAPRPPNGSNVSKILGIYVLGHTVGETFLATRSAVRRGATATHSSACSRHPK